MKKISFAAIGAISLGLAACGSTAEEATENAEAEAVETYEEATDNLVDDMDNAVDEVEEVAAPVIEEIDETDVTVDGGETEDIEGM